VSTFRYLPYLYDAATPPSSGQVLEYIEEDGHGIRRTNTIRLRHYGKIVQADDAIASRKVWQSGHTGCNGVFTCRRTFEFVVKIESVPTDKVKKRSVKSYASQ
jgi:hypothetical protein